MHRSSILLYKVASIDARNNSHRVAGNFIASFLASVDAYTALPCYYHNMVPPHAVEWNKC